MLYNCKCTTFKTFIPEIFKEQVNKNKNHPPFNRSSSFLVSIISSRILHFPHLSKALSNYIRFRTYLLN